MFKRVKKSPLIRMWAIIFYLMLVAEGISLSIILMIIQMGITDVTTDMLIFLLISFAFITFISILITFVLRKQILSLYKSFKNTTHEVSIGNFDVSIPITKNDAFLEPLISDINSMIKELNSFRILRQDFISNFSHEFKTPIVSIKGFAELLLNDGDSLTEEEKREYLEIINEESARLSNLARNSLLLSKVETQSIVENREVYSLNDQVAKVIFLFEKEMQEKNLKVKTDLEHITYEWDSTLTKQVLINLISNAVKYSNEGGFIEIALKKEDEKIKISVKDNGIGIDESEHKNIFGRFYQCDPSHKTEGSGLGLTIVRAIVLLAKGEITVNSKKGEGSEFIVTLPAKQA